MGKWRFTEIPRRQEYSFNAVLERFHNNKVTGFMRENLQNALDGKNLELDSPVVVKIETGQVYVKELPGVEQVLERIHVLEGGNIYANETIAAMQASVNKEFVNFISIEDDNTIGLSGATDLSGGGTFHVYAYNKGNHFVDSNSEHEKMRGGSHGIGKIASNAASDLHLMYFSNCDENNHQHIAGNVELVEHKFNGKWFRSSAYFTNEQQGTFIPYVNNYSGIFEKKTRGLKIIVPFFKEVYNDSKEIVESICDSFFIAVLQRKLVIHLNGDLIDHTNIDKFIKSENYYIQDISMMKKQFTPMYLNTYLLNNKKEIMVHDKKGKEFLFDLYFDYDESIKKGRTAVIRTVGMKIEDLKVPGKATKPYNAVLIPKSGTEDQFLKSLENESHTSLSTDHIKDKEVLQNAKKFVSNLHRAIGEVIDEYVRLNNPVDGKVDTSDVLYDIENKFEKDLKKSSPVVKVNQGGKELNIVKSGKETRRKKERKSLKQKLKKKKDSKRTGNIGKKKEKVEYYLNPSNVRRFHRDNEELLRIDLNDHENVKHHTKCNLSINLVDGQGEEEVIDFDLNEVINSVKSSNTGDLVDIKSKTLQNVPIKDGVIDLIISTNSKYISTYKYSYHMEVVK